VFTGNKLLYSVAHRVVIEAGNPVVDFACPDRNGGDHPHFMIFVS
jgi:hypothetical protein